VPVNASAGTPYPPDFFLLKSGPMDLKKARLDEARTHPVSAKLLDWAKRAR
jgi:hypothetical protein